MSSTKAVWLLRTSAVALAFAAAGAPAFAQTQSAPAAPAPTDAPPAQAQPAGKGPAVLQEIVVTADRKNSFSADLVQAGSFRGARQIDTPMTVSVIPQELIQSQQATGILDALRNTAGVTSAQTAPTVFNNIAIRGILVDDRANFRLNGALPVVNLIDLPLEDKDRVEALKGASALYYGFTTPSGVINLTMKRPTVQPLLEVTAFGDSHAGGGVHLDAAGTSGMFGGRVNVVYANVDSGIENTAGHRELISGAFDFKPTDYLTFNLDAEHIEKVVNEPGVFHFTTFTPSSVANPYPSVTLPPLVDSRINFGPAWARNNAVENNYLFHANWKVTEAWNLGFNYGVSNESRDRISSTLNPTNLATGEGALSVLMQPDATYNNKYIAGELAGTFYTGPLLHEILAGVSENRRDVFTSNTVAATCPGATPASPGVTCTQNFFNPRPIPQTALPVRTGVPSYIDDKGVYAFDRIKFGEWLQVLGGVRKSDYLDFNETTQKATSDLSPLSYSYGAVLKPVSWASVYATYIQGLEETPLAPVTAANAGQSLPATESEQREAGIKIEPRKGLLIQAAYFDINRAATFVNASNVYVQDGRAEYKGFELSLTGEVTRELSLYASALFLDAKQTSGAASTTTNGVYSPTLVGRQIENTPKTTGSIAFEYRLTQWVPGFSLNGGLYYTGSRPIDSLNRAFVPAYTLVDLGAAYHTVIIDHGTTFRINAQNIGNTRYWATTGQDFLGEGTPTTVKFSVAATF